MARSRAFCAGCFQGLTGSRCPTSTSRRACCSACAAAMSSGWTKCPCRISRAHALCPPPRRMRAQCRRAPGLAGRLAVDAAVANRRAPTAAAERDRGRSFAQIRFLASSLHRACATMELLREAAGLPPTGYRADHRLMEMHCGDQIWLTLEGNPGRGPRALSRRSLASTRGPAARARRWSSSGSAVSRHLASDAVIVTHQIPGAADPRPLSGAYARGW
jgi:hypothetical protein